MGNKKENVFLPLQVDQSANLRRRKFRRTSRIKYIRQAGTRNSISTCNEVLLFDSTDFRVFRTQPSSPFPSRSSSMEREKRKRKFEREKKKGKEMPISSRIFTRSRIFSPGRFSSQLDNRVKYSLNLLDIELEKKHRYRSNLFELQDSVPFLSRKNLFAERVSV